MRLAQGPQHSDAGEARTCGPSVSNQVLYHWATALPDYPKRSINGINEFYVVVFSIKFIEKKPHKLHLSRLLCCNHTSYCVNMVSVASALRYITSASKQILDVHPWSDSTEFSGIGRGSSDCILRLNLLIRTFSKIWKMVDLMNEMILRQWGDNQV